MKILFAHNYYQHLGGEDISSSSEGAILQKMGHKVIWYTRDNNELRELTKSVKIRLLNETIWSARTYSEVLNVLAVQKPDLVHVNNFFPLISPSIFYACKEAGIPAIMSLRNYRLICPNGLFTRDNHPCEDCMGKVVAVPGIWHKCYRGSSTQTAAVAVMQAFHRWRKTWDIAVDHFIALSEFTKRKMVEGGLDSKKIVVKPNFVEDPGRNTFRGEYAIFVGRVTIEKGIRTLIKAWEQLPGIPLIIVGDGPFLDGMMKSCVINPKIRILGQRSHAETMELIKKARFLIFPTEWYETFGRVVIEAYACGIPVIASRIGAVEELVENGKTGFLITPQYADELKEKVGWLWDHPDKCEQMGKKSREKYEQLYTPEINYRMLMEIYRNTIKESS